MIAEDEELLYHVKEATKKMKAAGRIDVEFWRLGARVTPFAAPVRVEGLKKIDVVHEKVLKGQAKYQTVG